LPELLHIDGLRAGYAEAIVLDGVGLTLGEGRSLALLGRNGMGKTTLLCTIVGVTRRRAGTIALDGVDLTRLRPDQRAANRHCGNRDRNHINSENISQSSPRQRPELPLPGWPPTAPTDQNHMSLTHGRSERLCVHRNDLFTSRHARVRVIPPVGHSRRVENHAEDDAQ